MILLIICILFSIMIFISWLGLDFFVFPSGYANLSLENGLNSIMKRIVFVILLLAIIGAIFTMHTGAFIGLIVIILISTFICLDEQV